VISGQKLAQLPFFAPIVLLEHNHVICLYMAALRQQWYSKAVVIDSVWQLQSKIFISSLL
jgi:hypothetical protein